MGDRHPLRGVVFVGDAGPKRCEANGDLVGGDQAAVIAINSEGRLYAWPLPRRVSERGVTFPSAVSEDGLLYAGGLFGTGGIRNGLGSGVCDVATGRCFFLIPSTPDFLNGERAEALSSDGKTLYTTPADGSLQAISVASAARGWSIHPRQDPDDSFSIALSSDDLLVAVNGDHGSVLILNARTGAVLRTLVERGMDISTFAFLPNLLRASDDPVDTTPTLRGRHLFTVSHTRKTAVICDWDLAGEGVQHRTEAHDGEIDLTFSPDGGQLAARAGATTYLFNAKTLEPVGQAPPLRFPLTSFSYIDPGSGPRTWVAASGDKNFVASSLSTPTEELALEAGSGAVLASHDETLLFIANGTRINLALPRLYRELSAHPFAAARAAWYAEYGLWGWTRELLQRERAAGRDVPALLWARSLWMCGDNAAARPAFALAVARKEIPAWYAELCLSLNDTPRIIAPLAPTPRMESAYKKLKQARGPADPQTADARERLVVAYEIAKHMDLALPLLQETLAVDESCVAALRKSKPGGLELAQALATMGVN